MAKRKVAKNLNNGLPLYAPLKNLLESQGIDAASAGQTAWLFVSFIIAGILGILASLLLPLFDIKQHIFNVQGDVLTRILCYSILFHSIVVMARLKYLFTNAIFFILAYICFIVLRLSSVWLLSVGLVAFLAYMIVPIYSWRIKILDGIVYFLYSLVFYYALKS